MPRTAPAPNVGPAMCPGNLVQGGGGSGGGGGSKSGRGRAGKKGAGTGSSDQEANDGRNGSDSCGTGSGAGKCSTHDPHAAAGHPVDIVTGAVYTDQIDLYLPGLIPFNFIRTYRSSFADEDAGLGYGWSHSLAWNIVEHRRRLDVRSDDGRLVEFPLLSVGQTASGRDGWSLSRHAWGYTLKVGEITRAFLPAASGVATDRGFRAGSPSNLHLLAEIRDKNGNAIRLSYNTHGLFEVVDSVGRQVRFERGPDGRISGISASGDGRSWQRFASYEHDSQGDLVAAVDADGIRTEYRYEDHNLIAERQPGGLTFHYVYDRAGRCIETWGAYPEFDPALDPEVPELLADGQTKAKGIHHCRIDYYDDYYREVFDSKRMRRIEGNALGTVDKQHDGERTTKWRYREDGQPLERVDSLGGITQWEYDANGHVARYIEPSGSETRFVRDSEGRVTEVIDALGRRVQVFRNPEGNIVETVEPGNRHTVYRRDDLGRLVELVEPNGARYQYRYDGHSNLSELVAPNGSVYRYEYDAFGRRIAYQNPTGARWAFRLSALGRLLSEQLPNGQAFQFVLDNAGRLSRLIAPDGRQAQVRWGGLRKLCEVMEPDGRITKLAYDREGELTRVTNSKGEQHRLIRGIHGEVIEERCFDGRVNLFEHDLAGRIIRHRNFAQEITSFTRDLAGRIIDVEYHDGQHDIVEYDLLGRVIRAENAVSSIELEYDVAGRVCKETHHFDGQDYVLEREHDPSGQLLRRKTSLDHELCIQRDVLGNRERTIADGTAIEHRNDSLGREIARMLPGGGRIEQEFSELSQLKRFRVLKAQAAGAGAGPEWVGIGGPGIVAEERFEFSAAGLVEAAFHLSRGRTRYEYDASRRLIGSILDSGQEERFAYDETNNVFEVGPGKPGRSYGPGDRLVQKGSTRYLWDDAGRLIEKRSGLDAGGQTFRYEWSAAGRLSVVQRPDGTQVEFAYDVYGRRLTKKLYAADDIAKQIPLETTRFVWDGNELVHEVRVKHGDAPHPVVEERTYCFTDQELNPLAQRIRVLNGSVTEGEWQHYLNDPRGTPHQLVSGRGELLWDRAFTSWGTTLHTGPGKADTPFRFLGQYEDPETGLCYNRHRYYDPDAGRYISADPLEIQGSLNVYGFGTDPVNVHDPFGLAPHFATAHIEHEDGSTTDLGSFDSFQHGGHWDDVRNDQNHRWSDRVNTYEGRRQQGLFSMLSHTEKKINTQARKAGIGEGDTLVIQGTLPPCSTCKAFMKDLANDTGCNVRYEHDDGEWEYP